MPRPKKRIQHDAIVQHFSRQLRELRRARGLTQAELARQARVTTSYVTRLEAAGAAPGIDLVARLAAALRVAVTELLPATPPPDDLDAFRDQARRLFEGLVAKEDRLTLSLLTQLLARLSETADK
jgi:transcriptional regulator with XRE-family HTH domain